MQKLFGSIKSFFVWIYSKFFDNDNKPEQLIFTTILVFVVIIIVNIIYYSCFGSTCCLTQKIVTNSLLILTCFVFGGIVGIIFGFPKQEQNQAKVKGEISGYIRNTNIDLLADWLSKLLVGATIAQINKVLTFIQDLSNMFYGNYDQNFGLVCLAITFISGLIYGHYIAFHVIHEHFQDEHQEDMEALLKLKLHTLEADIKNEQGADSQRKLIEEECKQLEVPVSQIEISAQKPSVQKEQISEIHKHLQKLKEIAKQLKPLSSDWSFDTWKGFQSKSNISNHFNFEISAKIEKEKGEEIFCISLSIEITSNEIQEIEQMSFLSDKYIAVFLHPTFTTYRRYVKLQKLKDEDKLKCDLEFYAYESFTVGILLLLQNETSFVTTEYDLSKTPKKPKGFN